MITTTTLVNDDGSNPGALVTLTLNPANAIPAQDKTMTIASVALRMKISSAVYVSSVSPPAASRQKRPAGCRRSQGGLTVTFAKDILKGLQEVTMQTQLRSLLLPLLLVVVVLTVVPSLTRPALAAGACHGASSCPSPKSCGSWSSFYDCDAAFCGWDDFCITKTGSEEALVQPREQFRSCVLSDGSTCLEYSNTFTFRLHCNC